MITAGETAPVESSDPGQWEAVKGYPNRSAYCMAKISLIGFAKAPRD